MGSRHGCQGTRCLNRNRMSDVWGLESGLVWWRKIGVRHYRAVIQWWRWSKWRILRTRGLRSVFALHVRLFGDQIGMQWFGGSFVHTHLVRIAFLRGLLFSLLILDDSTLHNTKLQLKWSSKRAWTAVLAGKTILHIILIFYSTSIHSFFETLCPHRFT